MGVREAQKQATRERVVEAARRLFEEVGYEETTIRMVAERAGVSVGSVFTTFESKVDIFNYILFEKFEALFSELQRISPYLRGSACHRIASLMSIAYGVECQQLDLMISHLAASHGWPRRIEDEHNKRRARLIGLFRDALDQGVASGELRADVDLDLFVTMLLDIYVRNYRRAYYERLTPEDLSALTERQLNLLFAGAAAENGGAEAQPRSAQG
ncbi:MAG: TetR/AcrR family transcriptional regulator [Proteobacteria bacterium]|nr:TetR/AcrR family transcriptional regulator [Pseudomonadota bacterium]